MLQPQTDTTRPGDRSRPAGRDRAVDAGAALLTAAVAGLFVLAHRSSEPPPLPPAGWELSVGTAAAVATLLLRRRRPVALAVGLIAFGTISAAAFGAAVVALFSVAMSRSWRVTAAVAGFRAATVLVLFRLGTSDPREFWEAVATVLLLDLVLVVSGMLVRSQRLLVRSLRARAAQTEAGQRLRVEEARQLERERIAREMHGVLAHRISMLTVHAGALDFGPSTPPGQISRAAGVIRRCAFDALEDLREVIGVLRDDTGSADAERPQPTLADLPELIEDSRRTGTPVTLDARVADLSAVPASIGRHAYRVVQEGLTNARKHAAGVPVRVAVAGTPGAELTVELRNPLPPAAPVGIPGAGLIGLRERAGLAGGRLEHGRAPGGDFRLWVSLPWPR